MQTHQIICTYVHVHALGDCLSSRPKGHSWPRELWFSIYSCTYMYMYMYIMKRLQNSEYF